MSVCPHPQEAPFLHARYPRCGDCGAPWEVVMRQRRSMPELVGLVQAAVDWRDWHVDRPEHLPGTEAVKNLLAAIARLRAAYQ